jgi:hypothetical protein
MRGAPLCSRPTRPGRVRRLRKNSDSSGFGRGTTGARLHRVLKNSAVRSFLGGTEIQCLREKLVFEQSSGTKCPTIQPWRGVRA